MRDISPGRNVQLQPYGVTAKARVLDKEAAAFGTADDARVGLDAKLVMRDALALDVTVNPDEERGVFDEERPLLREEHPVDRKARPMGSRRHRHQ